MGDKPLPEPMMTHCFETKPEIVLWYLFVSLTFTCPKIKKYTDQWIVNNISWNKPNSVDKADIFIHEHDVTMDFGILSTKHVLFQTIH